MRAKWVFEKKTFDANKYNSRYSKLFLYKLLCRTRWYFCLCLKQLIIFKGLRNPTISPVRSMICLLFADLLCQIQTFLFLLWEDFVTDEGNCNLKCYPRSLWTFKNPDELLEFLAAQRYALRVIEEEEPKRRDRMSMGNVMDFITRVGTCVPQIRTHFK